MDIDNHDIDVELLELCKSKIGKEEINQDQKIENIECIDENKLTKQEIEHYEKIGENIISQGKYAIVTMAGGMRNKTWIFRPKRNIFSKCKTKA